MRMIMFTNAMRGVDKRMSYNLRLIGMVMAGEEKDVDLFGQDDEKLEEKMKELKVQDRKKMILSKVKNLKEFVVKKL